MFVTGRSDYNSNLCTMRPELIGSPVVFLIRATAGTRLLRSLCFVALALFYVGDYIVLFPLGALLHDFHPERSRWLERTWSLAALCAVGLLLCPGAAAVIGFSVANLFVNAKRSVVRQTRWCV